jgi:ATP-binding cassette subfamily B protein
LGSHAVVLAAILAAVGCAIGSQYAVKNLVDVLGWQFPGARSLWMAVGILLALVAGDNLLWRLGGWIAARAFVELSGDLRLDLFEHLSGHAPSYFADRFPGALAGRIGTAATATLTIENSLAWTTIPPAAAVISSIAVLGLVNWRLMAALAVISIAIGFAVRHLAGRGRPLHDRYATRAAGVAGDLMDIIGNIGLVRAFGTAGRERDRLAGIIGNEMSAQSASLRSLEGLRLFHAVSVFAVTAGVLTWSVVMWRAHRITTGDVVLATTLGFTVLHASRDCRTICPTRRMRGRSSISAAPSRFSTSASAIPAPSGCCAISRCTSGPGSALASSGARGRGNRRCWRCSSAFTTPSAAAC